MMTGRFGIVIPGFLGATGAIFESAFVLIVVSMRDNVGVRCEGVRVTGSEGCCVNSGRK